MARRLPDQGVEEARLPAGRKDPGRLFDAVLSFFGVADRAAHERVWKVPVASFRRSGAYKSHLVRSFRGCESRNLKPRNARSSRTRHRHSARCCGNPGAHSVR